MKVLHVIETLATGGAERLLVTILPELVRQGVCVEVAVLRQPFDLRGELEAAGIVVHVMSARNKWNLWGAARDLSQLARSRGVDIVHAHLYFPTVIIALARWMRFYSGKTHASFHNLAYAGANKKTWKLELRRQLAGFLVRHGIDQPQAVSKASADHYTSSYRLKNVAVIHNALDKAFVDDIENTAQSNNLLVLPGRLVPEKGHMDLIAALKMLQVTCPPVIFAGGGPLKERLQKEIAKSGLPITISGKLERRKLLTVMASSRLVIIPSRYEGFGLTALEALALGKPVVATTAGGLPEVLGNVGSQVSPGNPAELAQAISLALNDEAWITAQKHAGAKQAEKFALPIIATQQINLYAENCSKTN